jgi:hypothetical protein
MAAKGAKARVASVSLVHLFSGMSVSFPYPKNGRGRFLASRTRTQKSNCRYGFIDIAQLRAGRMTSHFAPTSAG